MPAKPTDAALPEGPFEGRESFRQLVRSALGAAAAEGWPELVLVDASFDDWPLGERAVVESLQQWALDSRSRQLTLLASGYDVIVREHPRFVEWRRQWSHKIDCRACKGVSGADLPSAVLAPNWVMERLDRVRSTGLCGAEPQRRTVLGERIGGWLQRSTSAFPATTLGL